MKRKPQATVPVEVYEEQEPPRRAGAELKIPSNLRMDILLQEWDYSLSAIMMASKEAHELRTLRSKYPKNCSNANCEAQNYCTFKVPKNLVNKAKPPSPDQGLAPVTSNGARSIKLCPTEDPIVDNQDILSEYSMDGSGSDDDVSCGSIEHHDDNLSIT